ncbi:DUF1491 family protein [uncultured Gammaproteobacteria bacterium]
MSDDEDRLPTDLWVSAHIRAADGQGVPMVVVRRGDRGRGVVLLKVNRLDGFCWVLTQVRHSGKLVWTRGTGPEPIPEAEADRYVERQISYDPDLWVIEVEDRQGRHWFEGTVIDL